MDVEFVDFALAAWREDGRWRAELLPSRSGESLEAFVNSVRPHPGEGGVFGLLSLEDEFFIAVRVNGADVRVLISDASAAYDFDIAQDVMDHLGIPDDVELDDGEPAGDATMFADFGMSAAELEILCGDLGLYPEEQLASVAARMGFGEQFGEALSQLPE